MSHRHVCLKHQSGVLYWASLRLDANSQLSSTLLSSKVPSALTTLSLVKAHDTCSCCEKFATLSPLTLRFRYSTLMHDNVNQTLLTHYTPPRPSFRSSVPNMALSAIEILICCNLHSAIAWALISDRRFCIDNGHSEMLGNRLVGGWALHASDVMCLCVQNVWPLNSV